MTFKYRVWRDLEASELTDNEAREMCKSCYQTIGNLQAELLDCVKDSERYESVSAELTKHNNMLEELLKLNN